MDTEEFVETNEAELIGDLKKILETPEAKSVLSKYVPEKKSRGIGVTRKSHEKTKKAKKTAAKSRRINLKRSK